MDRADILTLIDSLAMEQQDVDTIGVYLDETILRLSQLGSPPFIEASLVKTLSGIPFYNYKSDMAEVLSIFHNDKQLFYTDELDLNVDTSSWEIADSGTPITYKVQDVSFYPELIELDAQSPDDEDTFWTKARCTIDEDGGFISTAEENNHYIHTGGEGRFPAENQSKFKISIRAKAADKDWIELALAQFDAGGNFLGSTYAFFDVSNGALGTSSGAATPYPESTIGNQDADGYFECVSNFVVVNLASDTKYVTALVMLAEADSDNSFAGDGSTVDSYVKDISFQAIRDGQTAVERSFAIYPKPSSTGGDLIPIHGEPFGEDFPSNWLTVLYSQFREDDIEDIYALPIALDTLAQEFEYPSQHRDTNFASVCQALSKIIFALIGVQ